MSKTILDKTLEQQTEKVGTIKTTFIMQNKALVYDVKERVWFFSVQIAFELPRTFLAYSIKMVFNEEPYQERVRMTESRIKHVQEQDNLLTPTKEEQAHIKKEVAKLEVEKAKEIKSMNDMNARCIPMEFGAKLTELKYQSGDSKVKFSIPAGVIGTLNEVRDLLDYYKMELVPLT
jgi:hypothetical protein